MEVWGRLLSLNEKYADVDLTESEVWLGRGVECHPESRYDHIDVSRKHCCFSIEIDEATGTSACYLCDNSSNGTFLNGYALIKGEKYPLNNKDKVTLAVPSMKDPEWNSESIGYSFFDLRKGVSATLPSNGDLTSRQETGAKKKKKKKKKIVESSPNDPLESKSAESIPVPSAEAESSPSVERKSCSAPMLMVDDETEPEPAPKQKAKSPNGKMSATNQRFLERQETEIFERKPSNSVAVKAPKIVTSTVDESKAEISGLDSDSDGDDQQPQQVVTLENDADFLKPAFKSTSMIKKESGNAPIVSPRRKTISIKREALQLLSDHRKNRLVEPPPISADYIAKVTKIQCLYLRRLAKRRLKTEIRRRNIAKEILSTEAIYVKHLLAGLQEYALPLKNLLKAGKKKPIITPEQYDKMFADYEKIYMYNARLLSELKPRVDAWNIEQCIGDIFVSITSNEMNRSFRDIYASYIVCYDSAQRMFDRVSAANPGFVSFVKEHEATGRAQSILSCLIMPVQRLPRYKLLLEDLLRHTARDHPDFANLDAASKNIHEMTEYIDGAKDKADEIFRKWGTITPEKPSKSSQAKKKSLVSNAKPRPMSAIFSGSPLKKQGN